MRDTSVKCPHCHRSCASQPGLDAHLRVCTASNPRGRKRKLAQTQFSDVVESMTLVQTAGVQSNAATMGAQAASSDTDIYKLCADKQVHALARPQAPATGWAMRVRRRGIRKTSEQLSLLLEEFLTVKATGKRTQPHELVELCREAGPPELDLQQLRAHHSLLDRKWKKSRAAVRSALSNLQEECGHEQVERAEAFALLANAEAADTAAYQEYNVAAGHEEVLDDEEWDCHDEDE